jgi:hypothetical protein
VLTSQQVTQGLLFLQNSSKTAGLPLIYGSLKASNVFLTRQGVVKLGKLSRCGLACADRCLTASFGHAVLPLVRSHDNFNLDCRRLGSLAHHMVTRCPDDEDEPTRVSQQKTLSITSGGAGLDVEFEPSPEFVDFLELCSAQSSEPLLERVEKHRFLQGPNCLALTPLVLHAERAVSRHCYLLSAK